MEMDLEDLMNYAQEYEHKYYSTIEEGLPKGKINFTQKLVTYNPLYNEEGQTLCHEMMHHHYIQVKGVDVPEEIVESEGLRLYHQWPQEINKYVRTLLK